MANEPIARVRAAIDQRDAAALDDAVTALTVTCNACHVAEKVEFIHVAPPTERHSPVAKSAPSPSAHGGPMMMGPFVGADPLLELPAGDEQQVDLLEHRDERAVIRVWLDGYEYRGLVDANARRRSAGLWGSHRRKR